MKKNIFILEPSLDGHYGNFTKLLSEAFSQNHEVNIATSSNEFNKFFIDKYIDKSRIKNIYFLTYLKQKIKLKNKIINSIPALTNDIEKFIYLLYIIIRFRPDIIMLPTIDGMVYLAPFFKPLIWMLGRKTMIYGFLVSYKIYYDYNNVSFLKKILFKKGLFVFDRVLINDKFFAKYLQESGFKTVHYMPEPIEDSILTTDINQLKLKWNLPTDGYLIGMTGVIDSRRKGSDIILRAASEVKRDDIHFVLAGDCSNEIMELLKIHNISKNLIVINRYLTPQEIHEIITCFDLVLLPYRKLHFGIASMLLRTMACNRPALVSKYGWLEKMSEKFDSIYSFEEEQDFFNQIQNIENIVLNYDYDKIFENNYTKNSIEGFINSWI